MISSSQRTIYPSIWYDIDFLNDLSPQEAESLLSQNFDVLTKSYNPTTDDFTYERIEDVRLRAHTNGGKKRDLAFFPPDSTIAKSSRVVAFFLHPNWADVYNSAITKKDLSHGLTS